MMFNGKSSDWIPLFRVPYDPVLSRLGGSSGLPMPGCEEQEHEDGDEGGRVCRGGMCVFRRLLQRRRRRMSRRKSTMDDADSGLGTQAHDM